MSRIEVVVIDYGIGNLLSVERSLEHCGAKVFLTADPDKILSASRVVLPGVGAFSKAMESLEKLSLVPVIHELEQRGTPLLGICLGMQLLLEESSEFGITPGLGIIPGKVFPIPNNTLTGESHKIPHIGWNGLLPSEACTDWSDTVLNRNTPGEAFYFVHSFMSVPKNPLHRVADCLYGDHRLSAVIAKGNITACQFHPEKSGEVGLKFLRSFLCQGDLDTFSTS